MAPTVCPVFGCGNRSPCKQHGRPARQRQRDLERGTRQQRGYTDAWLRAAKTFLTEHPFCGQRLHDVPPVMSTCYSEGFFTVPAAVVDHVVPHRGNAKLFWNKDNWQALCVTCHRRKTTAGL